MNISFSNNNEIKYIIKLSSNCYISNLKDLVRTNKKLRKIEKYFRCRDLLLPYEYLSLSNKEHKHIRSDYINFIARLEKFIHNRQWLKINV